MSAHVDFTLNDQGEHVITLETGYWTMESLQQKFGTYLKITKNNDRVTLRSPYKLSMDSNLCTVLGFKADHIGQAGETVTATNPPSLRPMEIVEVHCDIVENSYVSHDVHQHRHHETAVLYQFYPGVPHGYKISERLQYPHYVPVRQGLPTLVYANEDFDSVCYLKQYRYLENDNTTSLVDGEILKAAIETFQAKYNLTVDGSMNPETEAFMKRPRCGNKDNPLPYRILSNTTKWFNNIVT
ncbi:hypothetical protein J6590_091492 [Homalodisca vitripennis]|nr:hypothetical protein J6590_036351 [Homalodisca vitripennis]KAG8324476.1 hypothetical protein J6590_091492 [Homalodisca vitripennis]